MGYAKQQHLILHLGHLEWKFNIWKVCVRFEASANDDKNDKYENRFSPATVELEILTF